MLCLCIGVLVLLLPSVFISLDSQKLPKNPTPPKEPVLTSEDDERNARGDKDKLNEKSEKSQSKVSKKIQATLCDGRQVTGNWEGKAETIRFSHRKEGILYQKTLELNEIARLKILSWKAEFQKNESNGSTYKMLPAIVSIDTRSGEIFEKESGMDGTEFAILKVENSNGVATLYSMWIDLLYKDGTWYSGLRPVSPGDLRTDCHKDVIREIRILP